VNGRTIVVSRVAKLMLIAKVSPRIGDASYKRRCIPERKATHEQWKVLDNDLPNQIPMIHTIKVEGYIRCRWMQINGIW